MIRGQRLNRQIAGLSRMQAGLESCVSPTLSKFGVRGLITAFLSLLASRFWKTPAISGTFKKLGRPEKGKRQSIAAVQERAHVELRSALLGLLAVGILTSLGAPSASAQQVRDARIVLTAGGPTAAVRTMEFSADSRRLYVAGADKSVEIWSLPEARGNAPDLKLVNHARWPIARHDRGQIWALAINDARKLIAFGGYGAQSISGDISIADTDQGRQLTILPPPLPNEEPQQRLVTGHLQTVNSVSFSPNGEWLASMSLDGDLRLWAVGNWRSQQILRAGDNPAFSSVYVVFVSNNQFVASTTPSADPTQPQPRLTMCTIGPDGKVAAEILNSPHEVLITALGRDRNAKRWYSGDANGRIVVWQGTRNSQTKEPLRKIPVRAISASANDLVLSLHSPTMAAIAAGNSDFAYAELLKVTDAESTLVERREWNLNGETLAAAISAIGVLITNALPTTTEAMPQMFLIVVITNVAVTFLGMAAEALMAHGTADNHKGRAAGWFQAGNLGGSGLGGGAGLWIVERTGALWIAGVVLSLVCVSCCAALWFVSGPQTTGGIRSTY